MCMTKGVPKKPEYGPCCENHGGWRNPNWYPPAIATTTITYSGTAYSGTAYGIYITSTTAHMCIFT